MDARIAETAAPMTAARAMAGAGAAGTGLPLPQIASAHDPGTDNGGSSVAAVVCAAALTSEATLCGTSPPRTAAATMAANAIPKRVRTADTLGANSKKEVRRRVRPSFGVVASLSAYRCLARTSVGSSAVQHHAVTQDVRRPARPHGNALEARGQSPVPHGVPRHEASCEHKKRSGDHCHLDHSSSPLLLVLSVWCPFVPLARDKGPVGVPFGAIGCRSCPCPSTPGTPRSRRPGLPSGP